MGLPVIPLAISGPVTIALIVVLGIFVYPWLLQRRHGKVAVALATLLLAGVCIALQGAREPGDGPAVWGAGLIALVPALVGLIVARIQRKPQT